MKKLRVINRVLGPIETNTYLVYNNDTKACVILDPADDAASIESTVSDNGLQPEAILLTHGHCDHFMAADEIRRCYHIPVMCLDAEKGTLLDAGLNGSENILGVSAVLTPDRLLKDGEELNLAGVLWSVIFTPGHTEGGCCYYVQDEGILFCGDTLFRESYGRCDMEGGDERKIAVSIMKKLMVLPDETICFPGHMESTTIGHEKQYNPLVIYERSLNR